MSSWAAMLPQTMLTSHSNQSTFVLQPSIEAWRSGWKCFFFSPSKALTAHLHETIFKWRHLRRWCYQGIFSRTTIPGKLDTLAVLSPSECILKVSSSHCWMNTVAKQLQPNLRERFTSQNISDVWFLITGVNIKMLPLKQNSPKIRYMFWEWSVRKCGFSV